MPLTADPSMAIPKSSTFSSFTSALTSLPPTTTSLTSIWSEKKGTSQYSPELPESPPTPDENSSEKMGLSLVSEPGPEFEAEMLPSPIELKGDPGSMSSLKQIQRMFLCLLQYVCSVAADKQKNSSMCNAQLKMRYQEKLLQAGLHVFIKLWRRINKKIETQ